ncbi:hypothetical protein [Pseudonocardia sp. MH-G8]|uniref:MGH1-like glycoside hydrolase domain-containing protein n=1 Tax=Pseudonocardia sp. MH-G8 TaxID=1854588 RepID=UPI000BA0808F|nr:hypothetical protein [Pseudonocardia sp. MH-G8]OZM82140.1 hypothetical protein CFP66_10060 [Pseudonocardia sp. MH-G8]
MTGADARAGVLPRPSWSPRVSASGAVELADTYDLAAATLAANIVPGRDATDPPQYVRAGAGYPDPWTRDAALNAWDAVSLLAPDVAAATLRMVCEDGPAGRLVAQDAQWWDQIVWVVAAERHVRATGDREFLREAYGIGIRTLAVLDATRFDATSELYRGPALMQDGISGFPAPPARVPEGSSFVLDHPGTDIIACLSTNAVYVGALRALAAMAGALGEPEAPRFDERAGALATAIDTGLRDDARGAYGYLRHSDGTLDHSEEAAGVGLLAAFGVVPPARAAALLRGLHREPWGHVNVWPSFPRYDERRPGRHNVMCWPMVMGLVGLGALEPAPEVARQVLDDLAALTVRGDRRFWEIHDARTGAPSGGWQVDHEWPPLVDQTWSATAYLRLVHRGVLGLDPAIDGLRIADTVLPGLGRVTADGVPWRGATLDVVVDGEGPLAQVRLDGDDVTGDRHHVPADLSGHHVLTISRS